MNSSAMAVAEGDRAGLVEQQRVDVARGLDRPARLGDHVGADQPVHAGDADRREQAADGRRDQRHQQRDQDRRPGPCAPAVDRERLGASRPTSRKMMVMPTSRIVSAISFGVFWRSRALDQGDHAVEEGLAGLGGDADLSQSETTRVPPVTAERSPPLSRITGADSPGDRRTRRPRRRPRSPRRRPG